MLDGVAVGEIFTSPPPLAVLEAAKAVNAGAGVLFLLGNYSGDVMNFNLAAEMARAEGIEIAQWHFHGRRGIRAQGRGRPAPRRGRFGALLEGRRRQGRRGAGTWRNAGPWWTN